MSDEEIEKGIDEERTSIPEEDISNRTPDEEE